jgi:hypothetical protein
MVVLPNTHAGEQTRRLTAFAVSHHHIVHKKWTVDHEELSDLADWANLPTEMSLSVTTTLDGDAIVVIADISQLECSAGAHDAPQRTADLHPHE